MKHTALRFSSVELIDDSSPVPKHIASRHTENTADMMLSLAISTLGLQPSRLPLTRTVPLARMVSPQLQLARLDRSGRRFVRLCQQTLENERTNLIR